MKKILSVALAIMLFSSTIASAKTIQEAKQNYEGLKQQAISRYADVNESDWYTRNVVLLNEVGVINGYNDGTFKPNATLTRAQFIKMIVTALGYGELPNGDKYWASTFISKAYALGLLPEGNVSAESFDKEITRAEMSMITINALAGEYFADDLDRYIEDIKDYDSIPRDQQIPVLKIYYKGIITGYPDGEFKPERSATRAEGATILVRFLDASERKSIEASLTNNDVVSLQKPAIFLAPEGYSPEFGNITDEEYEGIVEFVANYMSDVENNVNYKEIREDIKGWEAKAQEYYVGINHWDGSEMVDGEEYTSVVRKEINNKQVISTGTFMTDRVLIHKRREGAYVVRGVQRITYEQADEDFLNQIGAKTGEEFKAYREIRLTQKDGNYIVSGTSRF